MSNPWFVYGIPGAAMVLAAINYYFTSRASERFDEENLLSHYRTGADEKSSGVNVIIATNAEAEAFRAARAAEQVREKIEELAETNRRLARRDRNVDQSDAPSPPPPSLPRNRF